MRAKKNREVNIFSASVVDLFASGLGVFLIVSIIALVNQKKESAKAQFEKSELSFEQDGEKENLKLKKRVDQLKKQLIELRSKHLETAKPTGKTSEILELKLVHASEKSELVREKEQVENKLEKMRAELKEAKKLISELKFQAKHSKNDAKSGEKGTGINFNEYQVGSKIRLENVQFYPGTDRPIEPYASREIGEFADYMNENPMVIVEVSGHIFETKKAIESGKADDKYNLSGARARKVCEILMKFGISGKRLNCVGYGASRYIHLTDDQYSVEAQKNRRVEIEILSK